MLDRWPKGAEITRETVLEARGFRLSVGWLAWHPLTPAWVLEALSLSDPAPGIVRAIAWPGRAEATAERLEELRKREAREHAAAARAARLAGRSAAA